MTEPIVKYQYRSPEGEVVETSSHEYHTRLKGLGYTIVALEEAQEEEVHVPQTVDDSAGEQQQAELTTEQREEVVVREESDRRVRRDRDNQRG